MMVSITCETVFWSIFYTLQYLSISGFGILNFNLENTEAKTCTLLIGVVYLLNSAYFVTLDNILLNILISNLYIIQMVLYLILIYKRTKSNYKILQANIRFI